MEEEGWEEEVTCMIPGVPPHCMDMTCATMVMVQNEGNVLGDDNGKCNEIIAFELGPG